MDTTERLQRQQAAVDVACRAEKRRERRRRPVAERGRAASPASVAPSEIRFREQSTAPLGETVEQWMARTGQQPEQIPPEVVSKPASANHGHREQGRASWAEREAMRGGGSR